MRQPENPGEAHAHKPLSRNRDADGEGRFFREARSGGRGRGGLRRMRVWWQIFALEINDLQKGFQAVFANRHAEGGPWSVCEAFEMW